MLENKHTGSLCAIMLEAMRKSKRKNPYKVNQCKFAAKN